MWRRLRWGLRPRPLHTLPACLGDQTLARPARGLCSFPRWLAARQGLAVGVWPSWTAAVSLSLAGPGAQPTAGTALLPFPRFQLWPPDDSRPLKFTAVTCGWRRTSQALPSLPPFSSLGLRAALASRMRPGTGPGPGAEACGAGMGLEPDRKAQPPCDQAPSLCPRVPAVIAPALFSSRHLPGP